MMIDKVCSTCSQLKTIINFYKHKGTVDGYNCQCKQCMAKYYLKNKIRKKEYDKEYGLKNKIRKLNHNQEYYKKNKITINQNAKLYRSKNKQKLAIQKKVYIASHLPQVRKRKRNYIRRCYKDINKKIVLNLRSRLGNALHGMDKSQPTLQLLGCSIIKLKQHLENQFTGGMTWNNHGKWHIDHIKPCASFDLSKPEEQKICFHYANLQPLWALDNLKKGGRIQ